jgi:hypothetical protein
MKQAKLSGQLNKRSVSEQIEYWAELGRGVSGIIDPETLIKVNSGLAKINVEDTDNTHIDPDDVFATLNEERESGILSRSITSSSTVYQASQVFDGMLECIDQKGNITVGNFENGVFIETRG